MDSRGVTAGLPALRGVEPWLVGVAWVHPLPGSLAEALGKLLPKQWEAGGSFPLQGGPKAVFPGVSY